MRNALRLIGRFRSDRRGNIAVIFAIACVPLISAIGCAVDYSNAIRVQAKLQSAADAASIASISQKSAGYIAAAAMTSDGPVPAGVTDATNIFLGNASTITGYSSLNVQVLPAPTVTKTGIHLASNVQFTAQVPTTFLSVMGVMGGPSWSTLTVGGSSRSAASLPPYLDFYLALDVSGSMGLPSTASEAVRMQSINPDNYVQYPTGCTLACHFSPRNSACTDNGTQRYATNGYCMGYVFSRVSQTLLSSLLNMASTPTVPKQVPGFPNSMISGLPGSLNTDSRWGMPAATSCPTPGTDGCIQLRLDAVGYAVSQLLAKANLKEMVTNQFRIGLYPFILDIDANYLPLTTNITGGAITGAASNLASELDTNMNAALGSGGTHIDNALHSINALISGGSGTVGDGSTSTNTLPYIFLVTDGAQDPQTKGVPNGSWAGSNHATTLGDLSNTYPGICATIKGRGIIISVLYIPYQVINPVNATFAGDEDDAANNNIPHIPQSLQNCASSPDAGGSYFYTANSPQEIQDSLSAMFNHSLQTAHLTH